MKICRISLCERFAQRVVQVECSRFSYSPSAPCAPCDYSGVGIRGLNSQSQLGLFVDVFRGEFSGW